MIEWVITTSDRKGTRYTATLMGGDRRRTVHFGSSEHENFTMHKDVDRRARYIARHKDREDWRDLNKSGAWARYLLWNKSTIRGSAQDMSKRFRIRIRLDI